MSSTVTVQSIDPNHIKISKDGSEMIVEIENGMIPPLELWRIAERFGDEAVDSVMRLLLSTQTQNNEEVTNRELAWSIAEWLLNTTKIVTLSDTDEILYYRDGIYHFNGEAYLKRRIQSAVIDKNMLTTHLVNEILEHIRRSTYIDRSVFFTDKVHLVLENGVLNLETMKLEPFSPDIYSFNKLPVSYREGADCPNIKKFLSEILYEEDIPVLQEWVGYLLWRSGYPAQKALLLVGEGENGKSTLLRLIMAFLGHENVASVGLQELETDRFAKADLFGKLANIYADLPDTALKHVGNFKMLTGGDPMSAQKKNQQRFKFINTAKLMFSCNVVPKVYEDTNAFFRRWIIIQFPHVFNGSVCPVCGKIHQPDPNLLEKLTTPDELSGFLNWALEGLARLKANNWKFSRSRSTEEVRRDYIRRSDPIKAFIIDAISVSADGIIPKKDVYQAFVKYCNKNKLTPVTQETFFKNFPMYFPEKLTESKEEINGKRVNCYKGITVKAENDWGKQENEAQLVLDQNQQADETAPAEQKSALAEQEQKPAQQDQAETSETAQQDPNIMLTDQGYICKLCGAGPWRDFKTAKHHVEFMHSENKQTEKRQTLFKCEICGFVALTEHDLAEHKKIHEGENNV